MASNLNITIPTTVTSASSKPYTIYIILIKQSLGRERTLQKRYSDFLSLHEALVSQCNGVAPPSPLPKKSWVRSTVLSSEFAEERRQGLQQYLKAINEAEDPQWRTCNAWSKFLDNIPKPEGKLNGTATHSAVSRSSDTYNPTADPTIWLDTHRELKAVLRDGRMHIAKREQANVVQVQHEASMNARSCLVKSWTLISSLEQGLRDMSAKDDDRSSASSGSGARRPPKLGEGEIRRRKDLLSAAKKERDSLENSFTAFVHRHGEGTSPSTSAEASSAERGALLKARNLGSRGVSSRRVLGAPVQETEQTRELDNQGVVQLQRQIMEQQDLDVTDLTKVVQRMKEMGMQINDELDLQNQMLDVLDRDTDRVGDKIGIAKKRIAKIK